MKRKLDAHDVPTAVEPSEAPNAASSLYSFEQLHLDARLLQAIVQERYARPSAIQEKAIPLALEGRDILGISQILPWFLISCL